MVEDIAEAFGHQQRRDRPLALDHRVGDDGRGMNDDSIYLARRNARGRKHGVHPGKKTFDKIVGRRQRLSTSNRPDA